MATVELLSTMAELTLAPGMTITFEAIDPATGLSVAGVVINNGTVTGEVPEAAPLPVDLTDTPPLYTPLDLAEQDAPAPTETTEVQKS
jgi:hypothetical protein